MNPFMTCINTLLFVDSHIIRLFDYFTYIIQTQYFFIIIINQNKINRLKNSQLNLELVYILGRFFGHCAILSF